jgi:SH3 domain protein
MFQITQPFRSLLLSGLLLMALGSPSLASANLFVTAGKPVDLRTDLGPSSKSIRMVEGGSEVEEIRRMPKIGFTKIKLTSGETGWVPSARLSEQAPDPGQLILASQNLLGLPPKQLEKEIAHTQTELNIVRQASLTARRMQEERDQLQITAHQLQAELEKLREEKAALNADQKQLWFALGAGALMSGILLGLIVPRLKPKRRNVWG